VRNTPRTRHLLAAGAAGAAVALSAAILPTLPAGAIVADLPGHSSEPSSLDARDGASAVAPTQAQLDAVKRILAAAPKGARATWDEDFGTPRTMLGGDGYLTGPLSGSAVEVARAWVSDNRGAFGMSAAQVEALVVSRDHTLPGTGTSVVTFTQVFDGVEAVHGGRLNVAVTKYGRVLSYGGNPTRGTGTTGSFALSPAAALGAVARDLAPAQDFAGEATGEQAGYTTFAKGPFAAGSYVKKVAFPTEGGARSAYRVLFVEKLDEAYDTVVDAQSGEILFRESLVDHESEGTVYENFPGDAGKGGSPAVKSFGPTAESPGGYVDPTGVAGLPGPTTLGNNASSYANYSNFIGPIDQMPAGERDEPVQLHLRHELAGEQGRHRPAVVRVGPQPRGDEPLLPPQPHPRRVLRLRVHRVGRQLRARRRRPHPRPRPRGRSERRGADLHRS